MFELILIFGSIGMTILLSLKGLMEKVTNDNIAYLKEEQWFQEYLRHDTYEKLITGHSEVRRIIATINVKKMAKSDQYHKKQQTKIARVLEKSLMKSS